MIPKKVHYCWLSGDPFPDSIAQHMATWKAKLPDYEFILWDTTRFDLDSNIWVKQAFESKKYAFAADYIRLYAVYNFGGIYMDTDVEVVKSFDKLLDLPYFVGTEGEGIIEAGIFGAEKGTAWLKDCLSHYDGRAFAKSDGSLDILTLPRIMVSAIEKTRIITELPEDEIFKVLSNDVSDKLYVFPKEAFCAKNHGTGVVTKTKHTYAVHHFAMSWMSKKETFFPNLKRKLMAVFGVKFVSAIISIVKPGESKRPK